MTYTTFRPIGAPRAVDLRTPSPQIDVLLRHPHASRVLGQRASDATDAVLEIPARNRTCSIAAADLVVAESRAIDAIPGPLLRTAEDFTIGSEPDRCWCRRAVAFEFDKDTIASTNALDALSLSEFEFVRIEDSGRCTELSSLDATLQSIDAADLDNIEVVEFDTFDDRADSASVRQRNACHRQHKC